MKLEFLIKKYLSNTSDESVYELHLEFYNEGYPAFNDNQLMAFLHSDNRFLLTGSSTESHNCFVSVNKKGKG